MGPKATLRGTEATTGQRQEVAFFQRLLKVWAVGNLRAFPWRKTNDPYRLLVAELMLRRTRASQVGDVYERFIDRFPSPTALAAAPEGEVSRLLRPLGLTWRVPAFRQMAQQIVRDHSSRIPREREDLLGLAGVGDYVADAVRCFAYGEPVAIVDTNTVRVAGRYFGFDVGPESRRLRPVKRAVSQLLDKERPVESNLALLDFAATVCKARAPLCESCPVAAKCHWARRRKSRQTAVSTLA